MSRFILYSGLAHGLVFAGVVTYLTTQPRENYPEFLRQEVAPQIEQAHRTSETVDVGVQDHQASSSESSTDVDPEANPEVRDRKMRASLPQPPEVPRVLEKAESARQMKKSAPSISNKTAAAHAALNAPSSSVPEMGKDLPLDEEANTPEKSGVENAENLELAPFDVDEIAEKHQQELQNKATAQAVSVGATAPSGQSGSLNSRDLEQEASTEASATGPAHGEEVRSLGEFLQKDGNKKPEYDVDDRKAGRSGLVVYLAYINGQGKPTEFQMVSSSGHRSLDAKTLKAIKTWEFQAGQEGWVEIPFQWDLKGGAQEAPAFRRSGRL